MQYILTEEEYAKLKGEQRCKLNARRDELQKLCTLAAQHIPVAREWDTMDPTPRPWGCILEPPNNGYCDDCPASFVCPHDSKEWSQ